MKGWRFYEEFNDKGKSLSLGTVIAVDLETAREQLQLTDCYGCIAGLTRNANSQVCGSQCSPEYLTEQCKRISEARARQIHPELFKRLDND